MEDLPLVAVILEQTLKLSDSCPHALSADNIGHNVSDADIFELTLHESVPLCRNCDHLQHQTSHSLNSDVLVGLPHNRIIFFRKHEDRTCWEGDKIVFRIMQHQQISARTSGNQNISNAQRLLMHSHLGLSLFTQGLLSLKQQAVKVQQKKCVVQIVSEPNVKTITKEKCI